MKRTKIVTTDAVTSTNTIAPGDVDLTLSLNETKWKSIHIVCFLAFFSAIQFSIYFSSTNQFLKTIDINSTEQFYGFIVSAYSIGNVFFSPVMGYISNEIRQIKALLYVGLICQLIGNFIYMNTELFPSYNKYYLLVGRFITGIGASNASLMKAYISCASNSNDRSRAIAYITGAMAFGATSGPAFQLLFSAVGYPGISLFKGFNLHMYNLPAFCACIIAITSIIIVKYFFVESYAELMESRKDKDGKSLTPPYDKPATFVCYFTRFAQTFLSTNMETLASGIALSLFAYTIPESIKVISIVNVVRGGISLIISVFYMFIRIENYISLRFNILICAILILAFHVSTYPLPLYNHVKISNIVEGPQGPVLPMNRSYPGCDVHRYEWCQHLTPPNAYHFYIFQGVFVSIAYTALNICLNTLFSKIIGKRRQAFQQGILNMSKGIAQMIGPYLITTVFDIYGPNVVWNVHIVTAAITVTTWLVLYSRMVPIYITEESLSTDGLV